MSLLAIFDTSSSAMQSQSIRLNLIASNLANANTVASSEEEVYKPKYPVFETVLNDEFENYSGVKVSEVIEDKANANKLYEPNHPLADENGYIYTPSVNPVEEMANMMTTSRTYQINIEVADMARSMLLELLTLGR